MNNLSFYKNNNIKNKRDYVFNSLWIYKLINNLKGHTNSVKIEKISYNSFIYLKKYYKIPVPLIIFRFLKTQKLLFKTTKVKVGGRIYQLPTSFNEFNRYSIQTRLILKEIRLKKTTSFSNKFIELLNSNILNLQSVSIKNRNEIYKTLVSYRGYLHYRWRV
jgi:ribosomal protein S7